MKRLLLLDLPKLFPESLKTGNSPIRIFTKFVPRTCRILFRFCFNTIGFVCVGNTFCNVIGYPASVDGSSMRPSINEDKSFCSDWVFVNCWAAKERNIARGDIVVFNSPVDPTTFVIKRVLALESDIVQNRKTSLCTGIPKGHCWVEGDNTRISADSSSYGPISTGLIFGKVTHVIFPPQRWRRLESKIPTEPGHSIVTTYPLKL